MNNNKIQDDQEFLFYLEFNNIDYKDYDYIENKTTKEELKDGFKIENKRWYENPNLWFKVFSNKELDKGHYYLLNRDFDVFNNRLLSAIFVASEYDLNQDIIDTIIEIYKFKKDFLKPILYEDILSLSMNKNPKLFESFLECFKEDMKDSGKRIGDIDNGYSFIRSCSEGFNRIAELILEDGYDASEHDSLGFIMAIKHANYKIAYSLLNHGAKIDTKNRLAYKMFLRNENKRICPSGEEWYHNELLRLFKENNKQKVKE
nr:MAG TPA_asm: 2-5A-dependent ribonuclease [Caudoviricetes sp.]